MGKLKEVLDEVIKLIIALISSNSAESSMRAVFVWLAFFTPSIVMLIWASLSIAACKMLDIPPTVSAFVLGIVTLVTGGKVLQSRYVEGERGKEVTTDVRKEEVK